MCYTTIIYIKYIYIYILIILELQYKGDWILDVSVRKY